jgi:branched-chain amino acid transport system permease protein
MEVVIYGLVRSVTFALLALGFTFAYGVSRLPNFAHGALYILAGFLTWTFVNDLGLCYPLGMLLGVAIVAVIGALIYRIVLIRLRGMPTSEIIGSYAFGLIILEGLRIQGGDIPFLSGFKGFIGPFYTLDEYIAVDVVDKTVSIFGFLTNYQIESTVSILGVDIDYQRLIIIGGGILLVAMLWAFTKFTKTGLSLTGIAQDEQAAMMLGVNSDKMAMISLAIGSAFAGIAALLILPLGNIVAEKGYEVLIYALAVCIIGGLGSWVGAIIASFILGFATILSTTFFGAMWEEVVLVGTIILILAFKPSGLMGKQKELEERT